MENTAVYEKPGGKLLTVRRVDRTAGEITEDLVVDVLEIMRFAYRGTNQTGISESAVTRHFADNDLNVDRQLGRMEEYINRKNSQYYFAYYYGDRTDLWSKPVGLAKISPTRPGLKKAFIGKPATYLNDIAVKYEGEGIGSALHHAMLMGNDFDDKGRILLDIIRGNERAHKWFRALGCVSVPGVIVKPVQIGGESAVQSRMQAPNRRIVRHKLEASHRWLSHPAK